MIPNIGERPVTADEWLVPRRIELTAENAKSTKNFTSSALRSLCPLRLTIRRTTT